VRALAKPVERVSAAVVWLALGRDGEPDIPIFEASQARVREAALASFRL
jgi:hypothetical protein